MPLEAIAHLKKILDADEDAQNDWRIHELFAAAFCDICAARSTTQATFNAIHTDTILREQRRHFSNYLFTSHYLSDFDAEKNFQAAQIYNSLYRDVDENFQITTPRTGKKIHVAFVAPNFCESSTARFFEPLLTSYDREKFFVTAWNLSDEEDKFTEKISGCVDKFLNVFAISFEEIAQRISELGADIFFDLGGHTEGGATLQIASYRPARVRMTSAIGYFDTTGLDAIDFYVTDKFLIDGNEKFFTEKILPLESIFAFTPNEKMIRAKKIDGKNFTFGCLNNFMKITDEYLECVKKILGAVPNSQMIFRDTTPLKSRTLALAERLKNFSERIEILRGDENFFTDYAKIDLILDTFPYTGGMMTALALYMGVPVLNLCGKFHSQRLGADMLRLAGMENFIVTNVDDYMDAAINYAQSSKKFVPNVESKLFDTKNFVKNFYDALGSVMNFD